MTTPTSPTPASRQRDAEATRERILQAGIREFGKHGLHGANTETIVKAAGCNIRMLYHYFDNKETLYRAALQRVYDDLRSHEPKLGLFADSPLAGIAALTAFTFDYLLAQPAFIYMTTVENLIAGRFVSELALVPESARPMLQALEQLIDAGYRRGEIHVRADAAQLYVSIVALSGLHITHRHTMSATLGQALDSPAFLTARRRHVIDMVLASLRPAADATAD